LALVAVSLVLLASPAEGQEMTDEQLIANALSAAPADVAKDATVINIDDKGMMTTLRPGTGAFTCMPDTPSTPGNDPMCLDANGVKWAQAWMNHQDPPAGLVGMGYMLQGGSDADNDDPYAMQPPAGKSWVTTGPHIMIFNATAMMQGYPENADDTSKPYVMFPGTPYAHLMVPVQ
jgi:hypothetical protein